MFEIVCLAEYTNAPREKFPHAARSRDKFGSALPPPEPRNPPHPQMWKICQAFRPRYQSVVPHSTPLPSLYPQRYLAGFRAGLGILIIEGKKQKWLSPTAGPFSFPSTHHERFDPIRSRLPAPGSRLPAASVTRRAVPMTNPAAFVTQTAVSICSVSRDLAVIDLASNS